MLIIRIQNIMLGILVAMIFMHRYVPVGIFFLWQYMLIGMVYLLTRFTSVYVRKRVSSYIIIISHEKSYFNNACFNCICISECTEL